MSLHSTIVPSACVLVLLAACAAGAGDEGKGGGSVAEDACSWEFGGGCPCVDRSVNLALGSLVDSPDGHEQDWCVGTRAGCMDSWATDGNMDTYWDEVDDETLYRLRLRLPANRTRTVAGISIVGFGHHRFSPRTFLVTCEELLLVREDDAEYMDNRWEVCFVPRECSQVEIVISAAYGGSPAIREGELFAPMSPLSLPQRVTKTVAVPSPAVATAEEARLLLPENIGTSACGHMAGDTLMCIGRGGGADECGALRLRHWECVAQESAKGRSGLAGHRSLNRLVQYRYGYLLYNPFDVYFAVAIELYGEWSELEMDVMRHFIEAGDTVVEAGVHIGSLTVAFAQMVGVSGRVVGFEPQRVLYQMAAANVAINGLWNVHLHNVGAGNTSNATAVPIVQYEPNAFRNFGSIQVGQIAEQHEAAVEYVQIRRIDDLELQACHFVKVDTEGFEGAVLAGARSTLARHRPTIYFEDNDDGHADVRRCPVVARDLVFTLGYVCFKHIAPYYNPDNVRRQDTNYFRTDGQGPTMSYMVLCVHPSAEASMQSVQVLLGQFQNMFPLVCS